MLGRLTCLALVGLSGVLVAEAAECGDSGSCAPQLEDESLVQLRKLGVQTLPFVDKSSFVKNSKPFLAKGKGLPAAEAGRILIDEDGVLKAYYLPGATTVDDGKTFKPTPDYRYYLMKTPTTDYSNAEHFYMPNFSGKTFSVDIDFKRNGPSCGCNVNFYLVDMPWPTEGKDHDHYCDAQCFPGLGCCAEFDMNEGNMEVQQITNHACTRDYSSHPDWQCHKWGDPEAKTHSSDFGPGADYTIDSGRPFTFSQRFDVNGDDFLFTTVISQDGNQVVRQMGPGSSQLNAMLKEIQKGMVFVTGYWFAPDMNWMDGELCGNGPEHCNMNPVYISNWRLTTNSGPAPPSPGPAPPSPASGGCCKFGPDCADCGDDNTGWCHQSAANCEICIGTGNGTFDASAPAPSCNGDAPAPSPGPAPPASGGCCKYGADCADCGDDNTGWCHQSAANCEICTGTFDASAPAPSCSGDAPAPVPTPPTPPTPPSPSPVPAPSPGPVPGKCCWGACSSCSDPNDWCNQNDANCHTCTGEWCPV